MTEFVVVACPEKHLAFTNIAYCSVDSPALKHRSRANYITFNDIAFVVEGHKSINAGEIGLSSTQRECIKVSLGATVIGAYYSIPKSASKDLLTINFKLELVGSGRKTVSERELAEYMTRTFVGAMYNVNQIFLIDYVGTPLKFTVKSLTVAKDPSDTSKDDDGNVITVAARGLLGEHTTIEIDADANKYLTFQKDNTAKKSKLFDPNWKFEDMGIGGLDSEFNLLFRRAFASRIFPPKVVEQLGIKHVKGMLLFGPPGTGKTLIARQIGKMLATREPKVVNGPEVLNKFVGQSEENIRKLFIDAEEDYKANGEAADLHMIIFDEIDAICKARASKGGGDTGVGDTVVNQLLSKIDGVNSLNNILVIGMTNRMDLIDPALLRPGRLEVHIEISLPDEKGRNQILKIHTKTMRENGKLGSDVDIPYLAATCKNFSGAELEGLVRSATSFALYSAIDVTSGNVQVNQTKNIVVGKAAFDQALEEIKPSFGVDEDDLKAFVSDLYDYGPNFQYIMQKGVGYVDQVRNTKRQRLVPVLLTGPVGAGKTSIAAKLALDSQFPFVRMIRPAQFLGMTETSKCRAIAQVFEDAYKSPLSCIVVDAIENLIEYIPVGPRFSNAVLQTLVAFLSQPPPNPERKLLVFATSNKPDMLNDLGFGDLLQVLPITSLTEAGEVKRVLELMRVEVDGGAKELDIIAKDCPVPLTIKAILNKIDFYTRGNRANPITKDMWYE